MAGYSARRVASIQVCIRSLEEHKTKAKRAITHVRWMEEKLPEEPFRESVPESGQRGARLRLKALRINDFIATSVSLDSFLFVSHFFILRFVRLFRNGSYLRLGFRIHFGALLK